MVPDNPKVYESRRPFRPQTRPRILQYLPGKMAGISVSFGLHILHSTLSDMHNARTSLVRVRSSAVSCGISVIRRLFSLTRQLARKTVSLSARTAINGNGFTQHGELIPRMLPLTLAILSVEVGCSVPKPRCCQTSVGGTARTMSRKPNFCLLCGFVFTFTGQNNI